MIFFSWFPPVHLLDPIHAGCTSGAYCLYSVYIIFSGSAHTVAVTPHTAAHGWLSVLHGAC